MRNEKFDCSKRIASVLLTSTVFSYTYAWKSWHLVGFEPTMRLQPYAIQIPYAIQKGIWSIFGRKKGVFAYTYTLKKLAPGGIWTHTVRAGEGATTLRVSAHSKNTYGLYFPGNRCILLYLHLKKSGTWWDLNPHCLAWRRCNHITRISPLAKYPKFGGVTAICRGSMTGKVLTRQLNGKTGIGWDLNTPSWNTAKASLHYA